MDIAQVIDRYHAALDAFATGDPEPVKALYARTDDVLLANPFGGSTRGWADVSQAIDFACSHFREGKPVEFREVTRYTGTDLVTVFEQEHWEARIGDRDKPAPFDIRATTVFRREDEDWTLVSRHADPLTTPHPDGPLRPTT